MKFLVTVVLAGFSLASIAGAECVPPLDPEGLMLSVVSQGTEAHDSSSLEIFSNGRVRVVRGCRELETWLESWIVEQIPRSLSPVFLEKIRTQSDSGFRRSYVVSLNCFRTGDEVPWQSTLRDRELIESAWQEVAQIESWLVLRVHRESDIPLFGSWARPPTICRLDTRRGSGLGVEEPAWCDDPFHSPFPGNLDSEQIRQLLRERLKDLPRGLDTTGPVGD